MPFATRTLRPALGLLALIGAGLAAPVAAQPPGQDAVTWTAVAPAGEVKPGSKANITLKGQVQNGWHIYGLKQLPLGPTSLVVSVDKNDVAASAGAATGSAPVKKVDPAFRLETQYYESDFTLTVPVKVAAKLLAGKQQVPVSVRFQTCNGDICHPPKTVRLSAPITVKAAG